MAVLRGVVLCATALLAARVGVDGDTSVGVPSWLGGLYQLPAAVRVMTPSEPTVPTPPTSTSSPGAVIGGNRGPSTRRPARIRVRVRPVGPAPSVAATPTSRAGQGGRFRDGTPPSAPSVGIPRRRIKVVRVRGSKRLGSAVPSLDGTGSRGHSRDGTDQQDGLSSAKSFVTSSSPRGSSQGNTRGLYGASGASSTSTKTSPFRSPSRGKTTYLSSEVPVSPLDALMNAPIMGHYHESPDSNSMNIGVIALLQPQTNSPREKAAGFNADHTTSDALNSPRSSVREHQSSSSLSPPRLVSSGIRAGHRASSAGTRPLQLTVEAPPLPPSTDRPLLGAASVNSINDVLQTSRKPVQATRGPSRGTPRGSSRGTSRGFSGSSISVNDPRPLSIFFEDLHYNNKAAEAGFCEQYCGSVGSGARLIETKAGRCPAIQPGSYRGDCQDECRYDSECPRQQRCCNNGCASVCLEPDFRKTCDQLYCPENHVCVDDDKTKDALCVDTTTKQGRCPSPDLWNPSTRSCQDQCRYDAQCPGVERCCSNGCAQVCAPPDVRRLCSDLNCEPGTACVESASEDAQCYRTDEKFGLCPKPSAARSLGGVCKDTCQYDAQCADNTKCCNNGCASVCLPPRKPDCETTKCRVGFRCMQKRNGAPFCAAIPCKQDGEIIDIECNSCTCIQGYLLCSQEDCPPVKPGFCPKLTKGYKGKCVEECSNDYDCKEDGKCCNTGCGHTCQQPVPDVVHPCRTVRFRCGDETRCAATRGLCQPGQTCPLQPLCVSRSVPFCQSCPAGKVCVLQKQSCPSGHCHRQPICVQLYSDDTIFREDEELELAVVAKQNPKKFF